jgi:hypothetical protein
VNLSCTWRHRGRRCQRWFERRFDLGWYFERVLAGFVAPDKHSDKFIFCEMCWVSGLGIGFWLRGVQPRTTMR